MRCLESIHLGYLPAPFLSLTFPVFGEVGSRSLSGKVQKSKMGKNLRDLASGTDYIICGRRGLSPSERIKTRSWVIAEQKRGGWLEC